MALGGGTFLFYNKVMPGTYINFVSKLRASTDVSDRGFGAMMLSFDWGPTGEVFRVDSDDFQKSCQKIFGYDYAHEKLKGLRDLFIGLKTGYFYRLNSDSVKAANAIATAKYGGIRGNDLGVSIQADPDNSGKYVVTTYLTSEGVRKVVAEQRNIGVIADVVSNDYVDFKSSAQLTATAYTPLTGGSNGAAITAQNYQDGLGMLEPYYFNTIGYAGADDTIKSLLINFTKRARTETGAKFQLVIHGKQKVNDEGIISVLNDVTDTGAEKGSLVYWTLGQEASCPINKSVTNTIYNGEYTVNAKYKQYELQQAITNGMFVFHTVSDSVSGNIQGDVRVLKDINTFTEFSKEKTRDFAMNQVIRVLDNWAVDSARLFNRTYLGKSQNDQIAREALWNDLVALAEEYARVRAIQNFTDKDIPIPSQGEHKEDVLVDVQLQPTVAMEKLYMTVVVA
jgi:hypothetical protein